MIIIRILLILSLLLAGCSGGLAIRPRVTIEAPMVTGTALVLPLATDTPVRYVCVIASTMLNLRVTPGTQEAPAAVLATGERLVWIAEHDGWTQIVYRDEPGYVKSEYVEACE